MRLRDWKKLIPIFYRSLRYLPWQHVAYLTLRLRNEILQNHAGRIYVNTFLPPMPSLAFDRLLEAVIAGRRFPASTYFAVTHRCPYTCAHCSYGHRPRGDMSTAQALDVIEQIKGLGTTILGFSGGEPLLRPDLPDLIAGVGHETETIVFTTGYGFDKSLARSLHQSGLKAMMIGLESDDAIRHDEVRQGRGSFRTAMEAVDLSLNTGFYTAISTMATRQKIESGQLQRLAELAARLGVQEFRILEPVPTGSAVGREAILLDPTDRQALTDFHRQWNRRKRPPTLANFSYLESDAMFGCGAGYHHLFVDGLGNVCPCDLTPLSFGNVLKEPLSDIWMRMGEIFGQARCGCLAQGLCAELSTQATLPLHPVDSTEMMPSFPAKGLPRIYANLKRPTGKDP